MRSGFWIPNPQLVSTLKCRNQLTLYPPKTSVPWGILVILENNLSPGTCSISNVVALEVSSQPGTLPVKVKPDTLSFSKLMDTISGITFLFLCTFLIYTFCAPILSLIAPKVSICLNYHFISHDSWNKEGA